VRAVATFRIGKVILKSLFKKPATLMYPVIPREWQDRTRGHISIRETDCILCGICGKKCPTNAITVDRDKRTWTIERMQCIQCGCCVEVCPKTCLNMEQKYTEPGSEKVVDTIEIPKSDKKALNKATDAEDGGSGNLTCNLEECVYCGLCAKNCPCDALEVDRKEKIWKVDLEACASCGMCLDKCPKKCLSMGGSQDEKPADSPSKKEDESDSTQKTADSGEDADGLNCNVDECVFCGLCAKECPFDAINVNRDEKLWEVDRDACVQCGACVDRCPKRCLAIGEIPAATKKADSDEPKEKKRR
jgi:formate hydrogenlyase subunit 6/NADH:ubiquinone oxidoreductase subunit I